MEVAVIASAAATMFSVFEQVKGARDADELAQEEAQRERLESEEAARRAAKDAAREESVARAKAAASGVGGLSTELYLSDLEKTHAEEIEWIRKSGESRSRLREKEGRQAQRRGIAGAVGTAASGITETYGWYRQFK